MFFEQLPQQLVNGIILGSIYALLALGYTMVYGIIKLINFAHGDIYMIGAFVGYYAINSLKMNFWIALVFSMIVCAILGVVIEFLAYRPLRNSTRISALITAIGVSFFLEYIMLCRCRYTFIPTINQGAYLSSWFNLCYKCAIAHFGSCSCAYGCSSIDR